MEIWNRIAKGGISYFLASLWLGAAVRDGMAQGTAVGLFVFFTFCFLIYVFLGGTVRNDK